MMSFFDFMEFVLRHPAANQSLRVEWEEALAAGRAAYRIIDGDTIAPISSEENAESFASAMEAARQAGLNGAHSHLKQAAHELRGGDWAASVRESIHAVEGAARVLAPDATALGGALAVLERQGHIHGGLKAAFGSLYGYTSDEEGVRHAHVLGTEAQVDEADAMFMLGACAAFVSYLVAKGRAAGLITS